MKTGTCLVIALSFVSFAAGAGKTATKATPATSGGFVFSLLPKSFQKNPRLDFNILTEMTEAGRKRTAPTAEHPAFYVANVAPAETRGLTGGEQPKRALTPEQIERLVAKGLQGQHYLPVVEGGARPSFVMLIHWGSYSSPAFSGDETLDESGLSGSSPKELLPLVLADVRKRLAVIERAKLIGGAEFARQLNDALEQEVALRSAASGASSARSALAAGSSDATEEGTTFMEMFESTSPLAMFMRREERFENMVEEVFSDSYYVVVSALDYDSVAAKKPVRLWRTKLSLNSIGVSQSESLPSLIDAGGDYFGKETPKNIVLTKRINRGTRVDIGEAEVKEFIESDKKPEPTRMPTSAPARSGH